MARKRAQKRKKFFLNKIANNEKYLKLGYIQINKMDKSVWLQSNLAFDLNKICTQNKVMAILFTIIFLIVANTNGNSIPNHVSNDKQPILVNSSLTNLIEKLNQFKKTYNSTLMNSTLLPFVGMCVNIVSTTKPALQLYDKQDELLCLSYFDMMNNLIGSGNHEYESPENVIKSLTEFDKDSFKKEFCKLFVGTLPTENEKLPYQNAFNQSIEILKSTKNCEQSCITRDKNDDEVIRTTCKLIAGGYHLINKNHHNSEQIEKIPKKIDATLNQAHIPDKQSAKEGVKNDTVPNAAAVATQSKSIVALNNKTTPTSDSKIIAQSNQSAINIINSENLKNENAASTKKTSPMAKNSDVSTAGKAQSETKQLIQTENQPIVDPNEQPADIEGDNNANNQVPDIPDEENSDEFLDNGNLQFFLVFFFSKESISLCQSFQIQN